MLGIALACMSLFASAASETKAISPIPGDSKVSQIPKPLPNYYSVTYNCGPTTIVVCCFEYYIEAYLFLQDNPASVVCPAIPEP